MIGNVEREGEAQLFEVALARGAVSGLFRSGKCRKKHRSQDRDDGDHNQQFNQGECLGPGAHDSAYSDYEEGGQQKFPRDRGFGDIASRRERR